MATAPRLQSLPAGACVIIEPWDPVAWIIGCVIVALAVLAVAVAPSLHRAHRRSQERGEAGSFAGLGSGLDAVWQPSAEEARADWEAQIEVPAPAPVPGDKGRIQGGRIVISSPQNDG